MLQIFRWTLLVPSTILACALCTDVKALLFGLKPHLGYKYLWRIKVFGWVAVWSSLCTCSNHYKKCQKIQVLVPFSPNQIYIDVLLLFISNYALQWTSTGSLIQSDIPTSQTRKWLNWNSFHLSLLKNLAKYHYTYHFF